MRALFSAEMLKLARQPGVLFFGFFAVPMLAILFKLILQGLVLVRTGRSTEGSVDLFLSAARALSVSGNSLGHLFYALGVASIFFLEYRYSTWRLIVPRSARSELLAAKFLVCLVCLSAGLVVAVLGDMGLNLALALVNGQGLAGLRIDLGSVPLVVAAFAAALLELSVLAALVATIVIICRSLVAAVLPAFLLAIGASILQLYLGRDADGLPLPSYAAQSLRDWLFSAGGSAAGLEGLLVLLAWLAGLLTLGSIWFARQQLATE
jgi:hypothetical protein